jgi:hypothetical protein
VSYPALYRAKSTRWTGNALRTLVPQVFGEAEVEITSYLNEPTTGMGWVMFQGGDPEFPVWLGPLTSTTTSADGASIFITRDYRWLNQVTETDPGDGRVKVDNLDPALATEVYISAYDLSDTAFITLLSLTTDDLIAVYLSGDITTRIEYTLTGPPVNNNGWFTIPVAVGANHGFAPGTPGNNAAVKVTVQTTGSGGGGGGGGGSSDEVWVGPSAPTGDQELWVDTYNAPGAGITTAWKTLTLQNSWMADASYQTPQYRKVGDRVELRGQMVKTAATSPTGQYPFIVSESGHQPPVTLYVSGVAYQSTPYTPDATSIARMAIFASGQGFLNEITPSRINPSISLNSISWSVTP